MTVQVSKGYTGHVYRSIHDSTIEKKRESFILTIIGSIFQSLFMTSSNLLIIFCNILLIFASLCSKFTLGMQPT